jgi:hypothetical protein
MTLITSCADNIIFFITNILIYAKYRRAIFSYVFNLRRLPNIAKPRKLSEMVQWRKCFDRNPLFCIFCDKLLAKEWVGAQLATLKIPETIWVGIRPEDIPQEYLGPGFVLKTTHASGTNYFPCKERYSRVKVERVFRKWLSIDWSKFLL